MTRNPAWRIAAILSLVSASAFAGGSQMDRDFTTDLFHGGSDEAAFNTGVMFSPVFAVKDRPTVNYTLTELQVGWMLTDVNHAGWLRGNVELIGAVMGGTVFDGKGSYMVGGTLMARYNFIQPDWRWVPFVQGGAGAELTDFDQFLIGEHFNFNLDIGAGVRYFIRQDWSLNAECRYQHLSNAKLSSHDIGINALGPMIGISHFF